MYLVGMIIITLCLIPDVAMHFSVMSIEFKTYFAWMFLFFLSFRKSFRYILILLIYYSIVINPFTGMEFFQVFLSCLIVFGGAYRLRSEIYTESYMVQAFWVFIFRFLHEIFLGYLDYGSINILFVPEVFLRSLWFAPFAIPFFMALDYLYDLLRPFAFNNTDIYELRNERHIDSIL